MGKLMTILVMTMFQAFMYAPPTLRPTPVDPSQERSIINGGSVSVDPRVLDEVERFEQEFRTRVDRSFRVSDVTVKIVTSFPDAPGTRWIGVCQSFPGKTHLLVRLLWSWVSKAPPEMIEALVFHELSHCLLGQDHRNGSFTDGEPVSVMNSVILPQESYVRYREYYLRELMGRGLMARRAVPCTIGTAGPR